MRVLLVLAIALHTPSARATEAGIDVGHVVDGGALHHDVDAVDSTGVAWVRINFRLDDWTSPDDATRRGPDRLTWFEAYDKVVDAYLARGIAVYALINDEAVTSANPHGSDAWIADYVQNAIAIVDHFKNRVRVYEIINEPNDFAGGSSARFTPRAFAKILQDTYLAVKHDAGHTGDRCWQVALVSGPLFSFDGASSADYLQQTYDIGRNQLAWDYTHANTGSYPLDGIGYHIYVAQGLDSSVADARTAIADNLGALWNVVTANEGATAKRVWLSEYGWRADWVGDDGQAARMQAGFEALAASGIVEAAVYFNFQDFPGAAYGVFDDTGRRRPSADMLHGLSSANLPAHAARIANVAMPVLAPGKLGDAIVTLENRGSTTWTDGIRLGAAAGCPEAAAENAVAWAPTAGYANSITDARVFLPADVPPGGSVDIHVPVVAPTATGDYSFAARMVHEGVTWFGPTITGTLTVSADGSGSDPGGGGDTDPGDHHGGCAATRGSGALVLLAIAWIALSSRHGHLPRRDDDEEGRSRRPRDRRASAA